VTDLEYQSILQVCDVGVISLLRSFKTDNFPNKIMNYMQYELPILASINPNNELSELINQYEIGLVSENGDDNRLKNNTLRLLEDHKLRSEMGSRGKILLEKQFNANSAVNKILSNF
jgi:glycosyltransferase involved in cell wall biosynthesis